MFFEKVGITNKEHLIETIIKESSLSAPKKTVEFIVDKYLEKGIEIYQDEHLAGYLLIFNYLGERSLHGYKLIEGHAMRAYRLAKRAIQEFGVNYVSTTVDQTNTIRLSELLGFKHKRQKGNLLILERGF